MTTQDVPRRKLIEVALPLEKINAESAREKSIRHGHPSTLHLWWARRPLAACRAVLLAQLVDDPSSHPDRFPTEEAVAEERARLHALLERLVVWENTTDEELLEQARKEIRDSCDGAPPPILDPFAGGGSIPLEAQRLGLEAHASDLNPVAVLINKALIEIPPKFAGRAPVFPGTVDELGSSWPRATGLAEDVRRYGQWMRDEAEKRIGHLYPKATLPDGSPAKVIAWIWARTVSCPNPGCGIQMPLVRSWWLGKKKGKEAYVVPHVENGFVCFTIGHDKAAAPTKENDGTVGRTGATCISCGTGVELKYIRSEGQAGRLGAQLMATVAEGKRTRIYLEPTEAHERAANVERPENRPAGAIPPKAPSFRVQAYGFRDYTDLFTPRQLTALTTFSDLVGEAREHVLADALAAGHSEGARLADGGTDASAYADAIATYLGEVVSRLADLANSLCGWEPFAECPRHLFARQAIPMVWDYGEGNPLGHSSGSWLTLMALPVSECVDPFVKLAGVDQGPQDVVGEVPEAQGDATQVLEAAVDRLNGPVRQASIEVGQDLVTSLPETPSELGELGQAGGNISLDALEQLEHRDLARPPVRVLVGVDQLLIDLMHHLDGDVRVLGGQRGVQADLLLVSQQLGAGKQQSADSVERVT